MGDLCALAAELGNPGVAPLWLAARRSRVDVARKQVVEFVRKRGEKQGFQPVQPARIRIISLSLLTSMCLERPKPWIVCQTMKGDEMSWSGKNGGDEFYAYHSPGSCVKQCRGKGQGEVRESSSGQLCP
jgi:hypothetical protein